MQGRLLVFWRLTKIAWHCPFKARRDFLGIKLKCRCSLPSNFWHQKNVNVFYFNKITVNDWLLWCPGCKQPIVFVSTKMSDIMRSIIILWFSAYTYCTCTFDVMFKKLAAVFYRGLKTLGHTSCFYTRSNTCYEFFERLEKHSTKSLSLWTQSKGSNCERKILPYQKNKLCLEAFFDILRFSLKRGLEDKDKGKWMICKYFSHSFQRVSIAFSSSLPHYQAEYLIFSKMAY